MGYDLRAEKELKLENMIIEKIRPINILVMRVRMNRGTDAGDCFTSL